MLFSLSALLLTIAGVQAACVVYNCPATDLNNNPYIPGTYLRVPGTTTCVYSSGAVSPVCEYDNNTGLVKAAMPASCPPAVINSGATTTNVCPPTNLAGVQLSNLGLPAGGVLTCQYNGPVCTYNANTGTIQTISPNCPAVATC